MTEFIALSCPTCGGSLKLYDYRKLITCDHCGNEIAVKSGSQLDRSISEFAITQLARELNSLEDDRQELVKKSSACDKESAIIRQKETARTIARIALIIFATVIGIVIFYNLLEIDLFAKIARIWSIYMVFEYVIHFYRPDVGKFINSLIYIISIFSLIIFLISMPFTFNMPDRNITEVETEKVQIKNKLLEIAKTIKEKQITLESFQMIIANK